MQSTCWISGVGDIIRLRGDRMTGVVFGSYKKAIEWFNKGLLKHIKLNKKTLEFKIDGNKYVLLYARNLNDCHKYRGFAFENIMFEDELSEEIKGFFRSRIFNNK